RRRRGEGRGGPRGAPPLPGARGAPGRGLRLPARSALPRALDRPPPPLTVVGLSSGAKNRRIFWTRKPIDALDADATRHASNYERGRCRARDLGEAHRSRLIVTSRLAPPTTERRRRNGRDPWWQNMENSPEP